MAVRSKLSTDNPRRRLLHQVLLSRGYCERTGGCCNSGGGCYRNSKESCNENSSKSCKRKTTRPRFVVVALLPKAAGGIGGVFSEEVSGLRLGWEGTSQNFNLKAHGFEGRRCLTRPSDTTVNPAACFYGYYPINLYKGLKPVLDLCKGLTFQ